MRHSALFAPCDLTDQWTIVFEDNIQEIQKKRVEQELNEDPTPVSPGAKSLDKDNAYHFETARSSH